MTKIWYDKTTGNGSVFDDAEEMSNWPDFQESAVAASATQGRAQRDELLAASDNMALADRINDDWRTYRQALRDIPAQAGFPNSVTWPTEPT